MWINLRIKIVLRIFADKFVDMVRIESLKITFEILQLISEIDEFKGAWIALSELHLLTNFNKNTLKKHLENLVKNNQIRRNGVGRGIWYTLI